MTRKYTPAKISFTCDLCGVQSPETEKDYLPSDWEEVVFPSRRNEVVVRRHYCTVCKFELSGIIAVAGRYGFIRKERLAEFLERYDR